MTAHTTDAPPGWEEERAESLLDGSNAAYLERLYEQYLTDPAAVPAEWREFFAGLPRVDGIQREALHSEIRHYFRELARRAPARAPCAPGIDRETLEHVRKQVRVLQLINSYRFLGHLQARVNPLRDGPERQVEELTLAYHGLGEDDLDTPFNTGSLVAPAELPLREILEIVQQTYCGSIGAEYMHISSTAEKRWVQHHLESVRAAPEYTPSQRRYLLERLTSAETLERYLHAKYVGQKRFSLEGAESLIPQLDDLIQNAGAAGVKEVVIGMAHRGRLNVLVNILGKPPAELFREFEGREDNGRLTGDVKYHKGFSSDMNTPGGPIHVALAFNPSHLEIVGPVVEGSVRARQDLWASEDPRDSVLPVLLHGDAAFAGQGVVMETFNMAQTRGFTTHGTVHIVVNNQIGFTTSTLADARSTYYCTDVAKMVGAPIFHVNGDDPEAVVFVTQIALDYRLRFHKDVVVDLVCYRRHGHNEADEPAVTQPLMYRRIRSLPTTRERYARRLREEGVVSEREIDTYVQRSRRRLEAGRPVVPYLITDPGQPRHRRVNWKRFVGQDWRNPADTAISAERFRSLGERIAHVPEDFHLHPRVARIMAARAKMASGEQPMDWGFGETLAYASLLTEGYPLRLCGQDTSRGTFFHRHALLHDQEDGHTWMPLRHLSPDQARCDIIDSLLSEEGVLAFEYGYATTEPDALVIWEAQFGDFANGAQVVIDQFISSGEQKWGRLSGLVMYLPHGYEGQGPEHSSARLERYLQLCAQHNMQVCVPTTPAQMFHMLRRQILRQYRKPLIVLTPKSLLRHPLAVSDMAEVTGGAFQTVIGEQDALDPAGVERLVLCSGKVYYELLERRRNEGLHHVALVRIEQLYPFDEPALQAALAPFQGVRQYVWCQEEPQNQGAWYSIQHRLRAVLGETAPLQRVSRPASASPAVGSLRIHQQQQKHVIEAALGLAEPKGQTA